MAIEILKGNLLESSDEAIILTVDGAAKGLEGNIACAFARKYPSVWEELEYEIKYPFSLGSVQSFSVHSDLDCPYKQILMAATLHHIDVLSDEEKLNVVQSALTNALMLANKKGAKSIGTAILTGGWRIYLVEAFAGMLAAYKRLNPRSLPNLRIYVLKEVEFDELVNVLMKGAHEYRVSLMTQA